MTDREFFVATIKDESPRFQRVLAEAGKLLKSALDWRPDPKSRSGWELITQTFGMEAATFTAFLETGRVDFSQLQPPAYTSVQEVRESFLKALAAAEKKAAGMSEKDWESEAVMASGEHIDWQTTKGKMAWGLLLDLIHHRGQLAVYLRPMGAKVPSIYGPSGDSQG